ncbi:MAG: hypothetical protein FK733_11025 [Asgard group archaeon]|nr:hypothetical protein [Asgard group archaeon]
MEITTKERSNKKEQKASNKLGLILGAISAVIVIMVIIFTFLRTPEQITTMLTTIASDLQYYFLATHVIMLLSIISGLVIKKFRSQIFIGFAIFLALSATIVSCIYAVIPNIFMFGLILSLLILFSVQKKLDLSFQNLNAFDIIFGVAGLLFGFWYLHWVNDPMWLNALLYSPLGGVNCPTLVSLTAVFCFSKKQRFNVLELTIGTFTTYFGFFGIFRLQAYVDIALVLCGIYLIVRNIVYTIMTKEQKILNGQIV